MGFLAGRRAPRTLAGMMAASVAAQTWALTRAQPVVGDAVIFLDGAHRLLRHVPLLDVQKSYAAYIALVAAAQWLHLGVWGVPALQCALSALGGWALYELGAALAGPPAGLLAAALLLLNPDLLRWNVLLLTDGLYITLLAVSVWAVWRARLGPWHLRAGAPALTLATAAVRPDGWPLPLVALLWWLLARRPRKTWAWVAALALIAGFGWGMLRLRVFVAGIQYETPLGALEHHVVIWGYGAGRGPAVPSKDWRTVGDYVLAHPVGTLTLMAERAGVEYAHVRPFYSWRHNLAVLLTYPWLYGFALLGAWRRRQDPLCPLLVAVIGYHTLIVAAFFADWDGRFLLHFFPLIGVLAACGVVTTVAPQREDRGPSVTPANLLAGAAVARPIAHRAFVNDPSTA